MSVEETKIRKAAPSLCPTEPSVEAVVVSYNSEAYIRGCLDSLKSNGAAIIVVDNGSSDRTLEIIEKEYSDVITLMNPANGYAKALNLGLRRATGQFVLLSNADVIYPLNSIKPMIQHLKSQTNVGLVGPQQITGDHSWQRSYGSLPGPLEGIEDLLGVTTLRSWIRRVCWPWRVDRKPRQVPYLDGAVLLVRREIALAVGGLDESFSFYGEEVDFCVRIHDSGWKVVFVPDAQVLHFRGGSSTKIDGIREKYVRLLLRAKLQLVSRFYSSPVTFLYVLLERMHCRITALAYWVFGYMTFSKRPYLLRRAKLFAFAAKIWKEELMALRRSNSNLDQREGVGGE